MSIADRVFIENCRDIISNGVWDTDRPVRPRWEDGSPRTYRKALRRGESAMICHWSSLL